MCDEGKHAFKSVGVTIIHNHHVESSTMIISAHGFLKTTSFKIILWIFFLKKKYKQTGDIDEKTPYLRFPRRGGQDFSLSCLATTRRRCLFCFSSSSFAISWMISGKLQKKSFLETIRSCVQEINPLRGICRNQLKYTCQFL